VKLRLPLPEYTRLLKIYKKEETRQVYLNYCTLADRYIDKSILEECVHELIFFDNYAAALPLQEKINVLEANRENQELLAYFYLRLGDFQQAKKLLSATMAGYGESFISLNYMGQAYFFEKDIGRAIEYFLLAEKLNPNNDELLNNIGVCYFINDEFAAAEKYFIRALKINGRYEKVIKRLLKLYQLQKRSQDYDKLYDYYHKLFPVNQ